MIDDIVMNEFQQILFSLFCRKNDNFSSFCDECDRHGRVKSVEVSRYLHSINSRESTIQECVQINKQFLILENI